MRQKLELKEFMALGKRIIETTVLTHNQIKSLLIVLQTELCLIPGVQEKMQQI